MSMATRVRWYLSQKNLPYDCVSHAPSHTSLESARGARVSGGDVAKCVLLEDDLGYVNAVLPADRKLEIDAVCDLLDRELELASEREIGEIFFDCALGAIPAVTAPYGIPTVVERDLFRHGEVYFESGDHENLVHMTGSDFKRLMAGARAAHISAES